MKKIEEWPLLMGTTDIQECLGISLEAASRMLNDPELGITNKRNRQIPRQKLLVYLGEAEPAIISAPEAPPPPPPKYTIENKITVDLTQCHDPNTVLQEVQRILEQDNTKKKRRRTA